MTIRYRESSGLALHALRAALALSVVVFGGAATRAWRVELPPEPLAPGPVPTSEPVQQPEAEPLWTALRAVGSDPFHEARQAPTRRYLLPEEDPSSVVVGELRTGPGGLRLVGTVDADDGGFAMVQLDGERPTIVRPGESLGVWVLRTVARGEAAFAQEDGTELTLRVPRLEGEPTTQAGPR